MDIWWSKNGIYQKPPREKAGILGPTKSDRLYLQRGRLRKYLDGNMNFETYTKNMKEIDIEYTIGVLLNTGYYKVVRNLHYYNALKFLFLFFISKGFFKGYEYMCELPINKFFQELYKVNPLLKRGFMRVIYNKNG